MHLNCHRFFLSHVLQFNLDDHLCLLSQISIISFSIPIYKIIIFLFSLFKSKNIVGFNFACRKTVISKDIVYLGIFPQIDCTKLSCSHFTGKIDVKKQFPRNGNYLWRINLLMKPVLTPRGLQKCPRVRYIVLNTF